MPHVFVAEQKPLLAILSSMQPICSKRSTIAATSDILFQLGYKELVLKSTDLEISLQCSYLLKRGELADPASFLVPGRRLFDIVKELAGDIEFTLSHNQLILKSGAVRLSLNIRDAADFPPFPERIENLMQLDAPFLLDMFNKVAFLIPQNNTNAALNGLLLELFPDTIKMTTTDGHCLAQVCSTAYPLACTHRWLLPRRAIFELKKILENASEPHVFLGVCGNQLVFSGNSFNFFTKLLNDRFPQYAPIIEHGEFHAAQVDRNSFVKALRRSACLLSGQFLATNFSFDREKVSVSLKNKEVGDLQEQVTLSSAQGELDIRFYAPYLLNGLQSFDEELLTFYLKTPGKPIIFESKKEKSALTYLVMPVCAATETTQ